MSQELIIKNDQDVKDHFNKHRDNLFGEFSLAYKQLVMYWEQEGDVLDHVQYCPFCGIKFVIDGSESR